MHYGRDALGLEHYAQLERLERYHRLLGVSLSGYVSELRVIVVDMGQRGSVTFGTRANSILQKKPDLAKRETRSILFYRRFVTLPDSEMRRI